MEKSKSDLNDGIYEVCSPCGIAANVLTCLKKFGRSPKVLASRMSTFHSAVCHICGDRCAVTEPRDFFYPDFSLLKKEMAKYSSKKK